MRLVVEVKDLKAALTTLRRIAKPHRTIPVLGSVLIKAKEASIVLEANDLETAVFVSLESVDEVEPGTLGVNCKSLADVVKKLPAGPVILASEGNPGEPALQLEAGLLKVSLPALSSEDFPLVPDQLESEEGAAVDAEALRTAIDRTFYAASTDETRYSLNGILLEDFDGGTRFIATDGHRLALAEAELKLPGIPKKGSVILPRTVAGEVLRLLKPRRITSARLKVESGSNPRMSFHIGNTVAVARCIEEEYPNYRQVIPKNTKGVSFDRVGLLEILQRVLPLSPEISHTVKLERDSEGIRVSTSNPDTGKVSEVLPCGPVSWKPFRINGIYLVRALKALEGETVRLGTIDPLSPIQLSTMERPEDLAIIMPIGPRSEGSDDTER